ncbi:hypothetical protein GW17_00058685 [Ensete ventricosum]|nr:hypothetical protein GW17_00058685 [Ensete ventricosum]
MFNKWQAQRWWAENYDKVVELYNVHRFNRHAAMPLPTPPGSEDESSKDTPVTPPLSKERLPRNLCLTGDGGMGYSSSDSLEQHSGYKYHGHHHHTRHACRYYDSGGLTSTPKLSSISGSITETSSMNDDASRRTSSSAGELDPYGELSASVSNASDLEREWVEEDEPGVYITIRELPGGIRELRRVRFRSDYYSHSRGYVAGDVALDSASETTTVGCCHCAPRSYTVGVIATTSVSVAHKRASTNDC